MVNFNPTRVQETLNKYHQMPAYDIVLNLEASTPSHIFDDKYKRFILDVFTFFGMMLLGMNHPKLNDEVFTQKLTKIAINKPYNTDFFTEALADFVETFEKLPYLNLQNICFL